MTSDVESSKSCFACLVVQHPLNGYLHPANVHVPPLALYHTYKAETHTLAPASILLYHPFTKQYIQIKDFGDVLLTPPPIHISPDSRSSELERERRSRSYDSDLSRSLSLALSVEGDISLLFQSLYSALSSRHPSADSERSLSRVWDDLSLEDLRKKKNTAANFFTTNTTDFKLTGQHDKMDLFNLDCHWQSGLKQNITWRLYPKPLGKGLYPINEVKIMLKKNIMKHSNTALRLFKR